MIEALLGVIFFFYGISFFCLGFFGYCFWWYNDGGSDIRFFALFTLFVES